MKSNVVLGISSGIAAYKTLNLIKELRKKNIEVYVIMTKKATQMISPKEFEKASGNKVFVELFEENFDYKRVLKEREVEHIALADKADVMVLAPATANLIAKLANGFADDFLTTTTLAVTAPIILCPSMNVNMWHNPVVSENITKLRSLGYIIINPTAGMLACGYEGVGRLAETQDIKDEILRELQTAKSLQGKKIIVTAGGTTEKIDDVRFITNRSSGKMGIAIAQECYMRGADVLLLRAKNTVMPRYHIKEKIFSTVEELFELINQHINEYAFIYHTAAVSDFKVKNKINGKVSSNKAVTLELKPQIKIIEHIKQINPNIRLIAFKAEFESDRNKLEKSALAKLKQTDADAVIVNDISKKDRGFEADTNEVLIELANGKNKFFPLASKKQIAEQIITYIHKQI